MKPEHFYITWLSKGLEGIANLIDLYANFFPTAPTNVLQFVEAQIDRIKASIARIKPE